MSFLTTVLTVSALGILITPKGILSRFGKYGCVAYFLILAFVIATIPIMGLSLVGYIGGVIGDVSTLFVALLIWLAMCRCQFYEIRGEVLADKLRPITLPLALMAIVFYPTALGLGMVDPYNWGFQPLVLFFVVAIYGIWLVRQNYFVSAIILAMCLIAYLSRLQESDNLWDYLLDPILAVSCWVWSTKWLVAKIRHYRAQLTQ